jgi:hypothetical protein
MDPFTTTAASGLTKMQEFGLAGIFLSLLLSGGVFAVWFFARHCEKRTDAALSAYHEQAERSDAVAEKVTTALHGVQIALVKLESKIER